MAKSDCPDCAGSGKIETDLDDDGDMTSSEVCRTCEHEHDEDED